MKNIQYGIYVLLAVIFFACKKSDSDPAPSTSVTPPPVSATKEVMINGYIPDWYGSSFYSSVDYKNLTIAYFAFIVCDVNGNINTTGKESKMTSMITAAHAQGTKAYLSFGGGAYYGSEVFYKMARNQDSLSNFVGQVKNFCLSKGFDGFDVDWEGLRSTADAAAHEALMKMLSDTLHEAGLKLAVTVQQGNGAYYFTSKAVNYADYVQIMSYDATGTWSGSPAGQHSSYKYAVDGIDLWKSKGVPASKLVLGVPFYGYRFANGCTSGCLGDYVTYNEILTHTPSLADDVDYVETGTYANTYFNGFQTIADKTILAYDSKLPGIMIWEMSQDAKGDKSLLTRLTNYLKSNNINVMKLK